MKVLLIDDLREIEMVMPNYKSQKDLIGIVARTYEVGITSLRESGPFDILFLDHDLASYEDDRERTGYDVMCFLEENPEFLPKKIVIVSSNPVGRQRMQMVIDKLYGVNA